MNVDRFKQKKAAQGIAIPVLFFVLIIEAFFYLDVIQNSPRIQMLLTSFLVLFPWVVVVLTGGRPASLGYSRENVPLHFGWGMVVGGFWRIGSLLLNLWGLKLNGLSGPVVSLAVLVLWIPFVEETFFRGYLGRALSTLWGPRLANFAQTLAFTLLPSHTSQGAWSMLSIFAFGLAAGWLSEKRKSIWAPWGAHAFANVLPLIALAFQ